MSQPFLFIGGPTAAGKSALALRLATDLNGEVVSLDSVQLWRGFDIGSGKMLLAERSAVPHHLIDCLEPTQGTSAGWFIDQARAVILDIQARKKLPVVCGGSNLYLVALLHGLIPGKPSNSDFRAQLESVSCEDLHSQLLALDPVAAEKIHKADRVRVIRALELANYNSLESPSLSQPSSATEVRAAHGFRDRCSALGIVIIPDRQKLYADIDRRTAMMLDTGLIDEVKALVEQYGKEIPGLKSLGYRQVVEFLSGELSQQELPQKIAMLTRRYAKRQLTFWRNEPQKRGWIVEPQEGEVELDYRALLELIKGKLRGWNLDETIIQLLKTKLLF